MGMYAKLYYRENIFQICFKLYSIFLMEKKLFHLRIYIKKKDNKSSQPSVMSSFHCEK